MLIDRVARYLSSPVKTPYFLVVGDGQYQYAKEKISELGLDLYRVSNYCKSDDRLPDIDALLEHLATADVNAKSKRIAILGLGEYLALKGEQEAVSLLSQLKELNLGNTKAVFLLRGVSAQIRELQSDIRFDERRVSNSDPVSCDIAITIAAPSVGLSGSSGIKELLNRLENGDCGNIIVNTEIPIEEALFSIHKINDAFEGIKYVLPGFSLPRSCGTEKQWAALLTELNQNCGSLEAVFDHHCMNDRLEVDFYAHLAGTEYGNWLYFIALKAKNSMISNGYLRFVLENTYQFEMFKQNVLNVIIEIPNTDKRFKDFYAGRKALAAGFPESDIAAFVVNNRKYAAESIYKLTDSTRVEREEIIAWVSKYGLIPQLAEIYPALSAYLKQYTFNCGDMSTLLTDYFEAYKRQKVANHLKEDFLAKVDELAKTRRFNRLPSRNEILDGIDKTDTCLLWLDALGVEYLAFISNLAQTRGLSIVIKVARADLPTITSINRGFFEDWLGSKKEKYEELDEVKHKESGGYNFINNQLPIHLAKELDIIEKVVDKAATELALRHNKRFLIVSDHGASRLAVLRHKEEKYETDTKGEHSGRCCKLFEPYDLPFAAQENGYLVLADYGRFQGSRDANVEVHGGASLEEVVVPIIELTLKNSSLTVGLAHDTVTVDYRTGTEITLFINSQLKNVSVVLNGRRFSAIPLDSNHYNVILPDLKKAGEYPADVYAGDDLIGQVLIKAQGKSGKINNDFNDLF